MKVARFLVLILVVLVSCYSFAFSHLQKKYSSTYQDELKRFLEVQHFEVLEIKEEPHFFSSRLDIIVKHRSKDKTLQIPIYIRQTIYYGPLLFIRQGFERNLYLGQAYVHSQISLSSYPTWLEQCFKNKAFLETDSILDLSGFIHTSFHQKPCQLLDEPLLDWSGFSGEINFQKNKISFFLQLPSLYFATQDVQFYSKNFLARFEIQRSKRPRLMHIEARINELAAQYKDESLFDFENISVVDNNSVIANKIDASAKLAIRRFAIDALKGLVSSEIKATEDNITSTIVVKTNAGLLKMSLIANSSPPFKGHLNAKMSKALFTVLKNEIAPKNKLLGLEKIMQHSLKEGMLKETESGYLLDVDFSKKSACEINIATAETWASKNITYGFLKGRIIGEHKKSGNLLLHREIDCQKEKSQMVYAIVDTKKLYFSKPYEINQSIINLLFPEDFEHFPLGMQP